MTREDDDETPDLDCDGVGPSTDGSSCGQATRRSRRPPCRVYPGLRTCKVVQTAEGPGGCGRTWSRRSTTGHSNALAYRSVDRVDFVGSRDRLTSGVVCPAMTVPPDHRLLTPQHLAVIGVL
jgi:hypothetical protein